MRRPRRHSEAVVQIRDQIAAFPAVLAAVKEKERETSTLCETFVSDVVRYSRDIRPHGIFSVAKQKLRALFGREPFTREQTEALELLTQSVTTFLTGVGIRGEARTSEGSGSSV